MLQQICFSVVTEKKATHNTVLFHDITITSYKNVKTINWKIHRIIEQLCLEWAFKLQPSSSKQVQLGQVAQEHVPARFWVSPKAKRLHNLSEQPILEFHPTVANM